MMLAFISGKERLQRDIFCFDKVRNIHTTGMRYIEAKKILISS